MDETKDFGELIDDSTTTAINTLVVIMNNNTTDPFARLRAVELLFGYLNNVSDYEDE